MKAFKELIKKHKKIELQINHLTKLRLNDRAFSSWEKLRTLKKEKLTFFYGCLLFGLAFTGFGEIPSIVFASGYAVAVLAIHLNMIKLYFKHLNVMPVYIILYICASEIAPIWLVLHILKF